MNCGAVTVLVANIILMIPETCGKRIVHGRRANIEEFPYQVSLEVASHHTCGGTVIHSLLVITAAHCTAHLKTLKEVTPDVLRVRIGADRASVDGLIHNIMAVQAHPGFKQDPDTADVALLLLEKPIQFNEKVMPIKMAKITPNIGVVAWITGYGITQIMSRRSQKQNRVLRVVRLPIVAIDKCRSQLGEKGAIVSDGMICAGHKTGHQDACKGDSGGPLVVEDRLSGITAWGLGCGNEGLPGVYTDVAYYKDWISDVTVKLLNLYQEKSNMIM